MGEAEDRPATGQGKRVKSGGLHLDSEKALGLPRGDCRGRLAEWGVGRPRAAAHDREVDVGKGTLRRVDEVRIRLGVPGRWEVVIARPLVPEGPVDEDEVGR